MLGVAKGLIREREREQREGEGSRLFENTKIIAVETVGAESLHRSIQSQSLVTLPGISSVAKSLGAVTVASEALTQSLSSSYPQIHSVTVMDRDAVKELEDFRRENGVLVEPACACSLSLVSSRKDLLDGIVAEGKTVVVIVCGGRGVTEEMLLDLPAKCYDPSHQN
jgi:L-serine/L-threonine ammonia-lyase